MFFLTAPYVPTLHYNRHLELLCKVRWKINEVNQPRITKRKGEPAEERQGQSSCTRETRGKKHWGYPDRARTFRLTYKLTSWQVHMYVKRVCGQASLPACASPPWAWFFFSFWFFFSTVSSPTGKRGVLASFLLIQLLSKRAGALLRCCNPCRVRYLLWISPGYSVYVLLMYLHGRIKWRYAAAAVAAYYAMIA